MSERKCIGCDTPIPSDSDSCPLCGAPFKTDNFVIERTVPKSATIESAPKVVGRKCAKCAMEIPKEASVCPYCRKPQGITLPAKIFLGLLLMGAFAHFLPHNTNNVSSPAPSPVKLSQEVETPLTTKGKAIKNDHPSWSNEDCNMIALDEIHVGMTKEQVEEAWGEPFKVNYTTGAYGTHEQWVMHEYGSTYVYFGNGIMTALQQSK